MSGAMKSCLLGVASATAIILLLTTITILALSIFVWNGLPPSLLSDQAKAERAAERYLQKHHDAVAQRAFEYAFQEASISADMRKELTLGMLDNPERARCVASALWTEQGIQCFQNYFTQRPARFFIKAPIFVEMRNDASVGEDAIPVAVSAHVQAQGVFVSYAE